MLEQLLLRLRRAGLLRGAARAPGGLPTDPPATIRSASQEVIAAVQGPSGTAVGPGGTAADQVTRALEARLQRAVTRALLELSLEELLFDLRSAEACRDGEAGLLLG